MTKYLDQALAWLIKQPLPSVGYYLFLVSFATDLFADIPSFPYSYKALWHTSKVFFANCLNIAIAINKPISTLLFFWMVGCFIFYFISLKNDYHGYEREKWHNRLVAAIVIFLTSSWFFTTWLVMAEPSLSGFYKNLNSHAYGKIETIEAVFAISFAMLSTVGYIIAWIRKHLLLLGDD